MWAIVPVKQFHLAKRRLAPLLSEHERAGLFRAMVADVLDCLGATGGIERVLMVTAEPDAHLLARQGGAEIIPETASADGLIAAVGHGARTAAEAGAPGIMVVPGDLPLARPEELEAVLAAHRPAPAVTLVPDARHEGTNCLVCSPPEVIDFHFGNHSFAEHQAAARRNGITPVVMPAPGLGLDIDTPADLAAFAARARSGHSLAFLEASGIASRLRRMGADTGTRAQGS